MTKTPGSLLRRRDGHDAHVTNVELFFDLVYVFAVTALSHRLLHDLGLVNALQSLVLWFAVWLAWQYTCWITNWFDPERMPVRLMLFGVMAGGMLAAASIQAAFGERGLVFAGAYAAITMGRDLFVLGHLRGGHALSANYQRIFCWGVIGSALWIIGALHQDAARLYFWIAAVAVGYLAPMIGFRLPWLGASRTSDWTVDGAHIAERCQLFVIVALGESILMTGASLTEAGRWDAPILIAFAVAFLGALAMWWFYFHNGSGDGQRAIGSTHDTGRMAARFHYVHVVIVAGVIVTAVGNELVVAHPDARIDSPAVAVLVGGPGLYVIGNAIYKTLVYGRFPLSHIGGLVAFGLLALAAPVTDRLMVAGLVTLVLAAVATWETLSRRPRPAMA